MSTPEGLDTATKDTQKKSKRKGKNKQEIVTVCQAEPEPVKTPIDLKAQENSSSSSVKKKSKFVNLYAQEGRDKLAVLLPGRQPCECLAQKHRLINNCLSCGWIVCEQEGSGPCLFCGSLVCTTEEQEILQRDSNKSQKLRKKPEWVDVSGRGTSRKSSSKTVSGTQKSERSRLRLQDKELQEISDGGWCLSMHQPWASLLVKGIKRVEGRMWYTSHRGRLWIAAAANRPAPQEIAEVEAMHRHIYKEEPKFPTEYPTDCLLGCVNVTDCLSQEQFREQYPRISEESTSPFVFICSNPQEFVVKFPMKGKHKIWKLESQSHQSAKKCLMQPA